EAAGPFTFVPDLLPADPDLGVHLEQGGEADGGVAEGFRLPEDCQVLDGDGHVRLPYVPTCRRCRASRSAAWSNLRAPSVYQTDTPPRWWVRYPPATVAENKTLRREKSCAGGLAFPGPPAYR